MTEHPERICQKEVAYESVYAAEQAQEHFFRRVDENGVRIPRIACLMCGKKFESEGAHNRICKPCKAGAAWRS